MYLKYFVELIAFITVLHRINDIFKLVKLILVYYRKILVTDSTLWLHGKMHGRIYSRNRSKKGWIFFFFFENGTYFPVMEIGKQETHGPTELSINVRHLSENVWSNQHISCVIYTRHPQPQNIGPIARLLLSIVGSTIDYLNTYYQLFQ